MNLRAELDLYGKKYPEELGVFDPLEQANDEDQDGDDRILTTEELYGSLVTFFLCLLVGFQYYAFVCLFHHSHIHSSHVLHTYPTELLPKGFTPAPRETKTNPTGNLKTLECKLQTGPVRCNESTGPDGHFSTSVILQGIANLYNRST